MLLIRHCCFCLPIYLAEEWQCCRFSCLKRVFIFVKNRATMRSTSSSCKWWHCLQSTSNSSRLTSFWTTVLLLVLVVVLSRITPSLSIIDNLLKRTFQSTTRLLSCTFWVIQMGYLISEKKHPNNFNWSCSSSLLFVDNALLKNDLHVHDAYV